VERFIIRHGTLLDGFQERGLQRGAFYSPIFFRALFSAVAGGQIPGQSSLNAVTVGDYDLELVNNCLVDITTPAALAEATKIRDTCDEHSASAAAPRSRLSFFAWDGRSAHFLHLRTQQLVTKLYRLRVLRVDSQISAATHPVWPNCWQLLCGVPRSAEQAVEALRFSHGAI
jgi:hypothetical protein